LAGEDGELCWCHVDDSEDGATQGACLTVGISLYVSVTGSQMLIIDKLPQVEMLEGC